jgi:methylated-DNA-[protein]-cysteine S-methyltransferase
VPVTVHRYAVEGWGVGRLWVDNGAIVAHEFPRPVSGDGTGPPSGGATAPSGSVARQASRVGDEVGPEALRRVHRHLAGLPVTYEDLVLDLSWATPFQRALTAALRGVPWGEVVSYGELALLAGRRGAARAAGTFCAHNRFALIVPCHRVVSANGIGGYGPDGVELKRRLLRLEGLDL